MTQRPRRLDEAAHLPGLGAAVSRVLQVERAQPWVPEYPVAANVSHLREPELARPAARLVEAERVRRPACLLEQVRVDGHHRPAYVGRRIEAMLHPGVRPALSSSHGRSSTISHHGALKSTA